MSVLGALLRVHPDLPDCEDAAQEALIAASRQWSCDGLPADPRAWLQLSMRRPRD